MTNFRETKAKYVYIFFLANDGPNLVTQKRTEARKTTYWLGGLARCVLMCGRVVRLATGFG